MRKSRPTPLTGTMRRIDLTRAQAARHRLMRDINRQIVLNYVREREPISRADIARATALQRSTVSHIIEELTTEGLVEESGAGESTGGRRPTLLRLRAAEAVAIGVSIELERTIIAASDLVGRVLEQEEFPTDPKIEKTLDRVVEIVRKLVKRGRGAVKSLGVTLPGLVDPGTGTAIYVPYFKWRDLPLRHTLEDRTRLDVLIDNDANATALAELWFGRPEVGDARDFLLVLVTAGVGTGIVFDGQIYRGERGAAGEFGHMTIGSDAPVECSCGKRDCWEAFSSERAAIARYLKLSGKENARRKIAFEEIIERALAGERAARDALEETARYLGIGIANLIAGFSPETVVVCGHITRAWPIVSGHIEATIEDSLRHGLAPVRAIASTLGEQPVLMGALSLVLAGKFASARVA